MGTMRFAPRAMSVGPQRKLNKAPITIIKTKGAKSKNQFTIGKRPALTFSVMK